MKKKDILLEHHMNCYSNVNPDLGSCFIVLPFASETRISKSPTIHSNAEV